MRPLILVLLLPACAGSGDGATDDGTTQTPLACDDFEAVPLKSISALDWPSGTAEAHAAFDALDGLWEAESDCADGDVQIRLTPASSNDFLVVTEPWPNTVNCGCEIDNVFQADSQYTPIGLHQMPNALPSLQILVDPFPDKTAPGGRFRFDDAFVTIFAPGDPLSMRACASQDVDPIQGSDFSRYDAILRQSSSTGLDLEVVTTQLSDGSQTSCTYTGFSRVE